MKLLPSPLVNVGKVTINVPPLVKTRSLTTVTLVSVILPVLVTVPLKVSTPPGAGAASGQVFVTTRPGTMQIPQFPETALVTEARGPPMVVVSVPRAMVKLAALPAQVSASVGMKLLVKTA